MRQVHRQHRVARLHQRGVRGQVGARPGVRLQVGVLGPEQLLGPGDAESPRPGPPRRSRRSSAGPGSPRRTCWSASSRARPAPPARSGSRWRSVAGRRAAGPARRAPPRRSPGRSALELLRSPAPRRCSPRVLHSEGVYGAAHWRAVRCLVTGATGYIGGRLAPRLLAEGHKVRCLARKAGRLRDVPWAGRGRDRRGRPAPAGDAAGRVRRRRRRLLPGPLARPDATSRRPTGRRRPTSPRRPRAAGVRRIVYLGGPEPAAGRRSPSRAPALPGRGGAGSCWPAGCPRRCCGPR